MMRWSSSGAGSVAGGGRIGAVAMAIDSGSHFWSFLRHGFERSLGPDPRGRARVEPGVEKHPGRRRHRGQRRAAVTGTRARAKRCAAIPASASARCRAIENGDRNGAEDVLPLLPIWELGKVVATHQPDETGARKTPAQRPERVGGVGRAEPGLDVADPDAAVGGGDAGRRARRSAKGAMPATGFSGFCGDTSHQTSSSSSRLSASRLICRCPPCAGLNEPPSRPMRRPQPRRTTPPPPGRGSG